jgi:hypothetical protein
MRRILLLSGCLAAVLISGCSDGSAFPEATGKGSIRAINAISTSPTILFLIEERTIDNMAYKSATSKAAYDDLEYTFNFDSLLPGTIETTRIASRTVQIVKDVEYTFVVSGDLQAPTITLWERPEREFVEGGTVLEASFGHMSPVLGDVDIFLADPAIAPAAGNEVGTLTPGDELPPMDIQAGDYVLTITTAGMPGDTLFTSDILSLNAASTLQFMIFDTDGNDRGPVSVRLFDTVSGGAIALVDPLFPPTIRFLHASQDLGVVDIFIDDPLTTPTLEDQDFRGISDEIEVSVGELPITYTAFDNIGTILMQENITMFAGTRIDYYVVGEGASPISIVALPDRRSVETLAKVTVVYTETNHDPLDLYIIETGLDIADFPARFSGMVAGQNTPLTQLPEGSYDLYLTVAGEKTVVAGPVLLDVALGDVVTAIVYDTVDTATADIVLFPNF